MDDPHGRTVGSYGRAVRLAGDRARAWRAPARSGRDRDATAISGGFQIRRAQHRAIVEIVVAGQLDLASAPLLYHQLAREQRDGADAIVVDLSGVTFIDSSGLRALLAAHEDDRDRLRIILGPTGACVIDAAGLREVLPIIEG